MPECINLLTTYGRTYRIRYDESYDPFHIPVKCRDPWSMEIPCQNGSIYPLGGEFLAAEVDGHRVLKARMMRSGLEVTQDGEDDVTFRFHMSQFAEVARWMKPRRKRVITEAQREHGRRLAALRKGDAA